MRTLKDSIDLQQHWKDLQVDMQNDLRGARKQHHNGSSGEAAECRWKAFFEKYLPRRYSVLHDATIIDSLGSHSQQIDLAIYDEYYTPKIWQHGDKAWIPAESVYCVVECKEKVQGNINYAGKKIASVRKLYRTSGDFHDNSYGEQSAIEPKTILGILVADRYGWKKDNSNALHKELAKLNIDERIEFICSADGVSVTIGWPDIGTMPSIEMNSGCCALIHFLTELDRTLRITGTVAPIDYRQYLNPRTH
jgi:hypothetical protein